jgi:hypothetical protein
MRRFILLAAAMLMTSASAASAATISFTAPSVVSGTFDVVVQAENVFGGRDELTDAVIGYGFDVAVSNPLVLSFLGATSGPLFDPPTPEPGTDVFGAASGFAIFPPVSEPLLLATLHFKTTGTGPSSITISSDLSNFFQGLQFLNDPIQESISTRIAVTAVAPTAVPEPATLVLSSIGLIGMVSRRRKRRDVPA